ncbi:nickel/cobalt exporter [Terrimicrobium sacchariphilum]|uniref:Nickel/cobalt efflux system n=1 Tax=Terrimicrobium sacchariphilum TaxID=690879 RepID=A0A146G735_TERSA|nr:sulfite exporter TauE/SafE family protein [Terrimicrobium sacchariphilum]GAT33311.1 nickel/cobalt exporter [Terrimicrobium sacchariphilum]
MTSFQELITQGAANAWLFIPTAVLLGILHGLEPGHSKTMMAAFIIAIRGTVAQAVLLGLSAAISHSFVIWLLAATALHFGSRWDVETTEPYFQFISGLIIVALAGWMFWRTRRDQLDAAYHEHHHHHDASGAGAHGGQIVSTNLGQIEVCIHEDGVPPRFRVYGPLTQTSAPIVEVSRPDDSREIYQFTRSGDYWEATSELPEPHAFTAELRVEPKGQGYSVTFEEHEHLDLSGGNFQDTHEREHAADIARRFRNRHVTTGQIVVFGLTGGLLPCPAAITVLLVCLQLKQFILGFTLVACFSFGLALTMVTVGAAAAWGVQHASKRFSWFSSLAARAPYFSSAILLVLGLFITWLGARHIL